MKSIFFIILFATLIFTAFPSQAALVPCGLSENDIATPWNDTAECTLCHFFFLVRNIVEFIAYDLAPVVAILMFSIGGIMLLTSGGSPEKISAGKKYFVNTVIGLVIIYASFLIIGTIIMELAKTQGNFVKETWFTFQCQVPTE